MVTAPLRSNGLRLTSRPRRHKRPASSFEHPFPEKGITALLCMQKEAKGSNQKIHPLEAKVGGHANM